LEQEDKLFDTFSLQKLIVIYNRYKTFCELNEKLDCI
jgi:hypothetical protein